jgi:hypothetical protein
VTLVGNGKLLQQQTSLIQTLVRVAMKSELAKILYQNAWPIILNRASYCKDFMLPAATSQLKRYDGVEEFIRRLNTEPSFGQILGTIVHFPLLFHS